MARQCAVADAHLGYFGKCGLERCQKFAFELAVQILCCKFIVHIAAYILIE